MTVCLIVRAYVRKSGISGAGRELCSTCGLLRTSIMMQRAQEPLSLHLSWKLIGMLSVRIIFLKGISHHDVYCVVLYVEN